MLQTFFVWLKEAPKFILCSLQFPYIDIFSKLFDPVDLNSHPKFVKIYLTGSLFCYGFEGHNKPQIWQKLFPTILNNPIEACLTVVKDSMFFKAFLS